MKKMKITLSSLCLVALTGAVMTSCGAGTLLQTMGSGGTVANIFTSVIGMDKVSEKGLIGTWHYDSPGVAFTSENLLAKAGGEMAAVKIEEKIQPYYQQVGITSDNTYIIFNEDGTFSAKILGTPLKGTYTFDEAAAKITLKTMLFSTNCYAKREYGGISVLFEANKLLTLLQTIAAFSGNQNLQAIGDISKQYDGVRIGFDMTK
jgi:hypothetical protein